MKKTTILKHQVVKLPPPAYNKMLSNYPIKNSVILMKASSKNKNNEYSKIHKKTKKKGKKCKKN